MDTRQKILPWTEAEKYWQRATIVAGYFDPMLAAHAARLEEIASGGEPVVVVIDNPPDPILPAGARAELVAGLAVVQKVILPPESGPVVIPETARLFREQGADAQRLDALIRHVHERQKAP